MTCINTGAASSATFDPASWLSHFESSGGVFALAAGRLQLWIVPGNRTGQELSHAGRMISLLAPDQRIALQDHLGAEMGKSGSLASPTGQPSSTSIAAGTAGDPTQRSDNMNMMTAIRPATTPTIFDRNSSLAAHVSLEAGWATLMASYLAAKQAEDDYADGGWTPAYDREQAFANTHSGIREQLYKDHPEECISSQVDDEVERLLEVRCRFEDALMRTPAPDGEALRWKLDYLLRDDGDGSVFCWNIEFIAQTADDYRRILGAAPNQPSTPSAAADREPDPIDIYWVAHHAYNAGELGEEAYMEAVEQLHDWTPTSDRDFVRKFEAAFVDDGVPNHESCTKLFGEASDILGSDSRAIPPQPAPMDIVGPDLTKAQPIEDVIRDLAPMRNGYAVAFRAACKASGIDISVRREHDGQDMLLLGCPLDGQEHLRRPRIDALVAQMHRGKNRRADVIELLNLLGNFADNEPFPSVAALADAYLERGGHLWIKPDGQVGEPWLPFERDTAARESWDGYPLRRLVHRYSATLLQPGAADAIATYVREHGKHDEGSGCYVLRAEGQADV